MIKSLQQAGCYPHPVTDIELIETHISWVLLTGEYAYKIKKPLNLGFLDFSTLALRQHCCDEELRLNRRFAPDIYLEVVRITGDANSPHVSGDGAAIEYAVKMRQFPQEALASSLLAAGSLTPRHVEFFAAELATIHRAAAATNAVSTFGTPPSMLDAAIQNFDQLSPLLTGADDVAAMARLRAWTMREHDARKSLMDERRVKGAVREGHGDLHLGNIVLIEGRLVPFDCIEFNPSLRWNDVLSEAAFLVMDLHDRGSPRLAWLFLNAYLEHAGDYDGVGVLRFYLVYRALVRAKIHALRAAQPGLTTARRRSLQHAARNYLTLAETFTGRQPAALIITHGLSGSGKSRIAGELMQQPGAIRIRSDVERKRLHGLAPRDRETGAVGASIYGDDATQSLYQHLASCAQGIIAAGYTVIVDAAFLKRWQRELLARVAAEAGVPFLIMAVAAPEDVLRQRILQRQSADDDPSDAGIAVLEHQLKTREPLSAGEHGMSMELSSDGPDPAACSLRVIDALKSRRQY